MKSDHPNALCVTVAVLTYRRPEDLAVIIPHLLRQVEKARLSGYTANLLVIDNDPEQSARAVVDRMDLPSVRYVCEPTAGVAAARNRALDESSESALLAFIDDDEEPSEQWLSNLLITHSKTGASAVAGRVIPRFVGEVDPWIEAGSFFVRRSLPTGTPVAAAGAGNLLLDLRHIRSLGLRFDPALGLSGGEDTLFTRSLTKAGGTIAWCEEATAYDRVPQERARRSWVLVRALSHGNTAGLIDIRLSGSGRARVKTRFRIVAKGAARVVGGASRALAGYVISSRRHQARGSRAMWRGLGMLLAASGLTYQEYSRDGRRVVSSRRARADWPSVTPDATSEQRPITALLSFPQQPPRGNPYRVLLQDALESEGSLRVLNFTWRTALLTHYDVFHVHWPEILVSGATPLRAATRQLMFAALLIKVRLLRIPIVRTVHNLELPQGISRRQRLLLQWCDRQTAMRIRINESTRFDQGIAFETSLHGHYRDWFARYELPPARPGRVLFFGLVRRYKGVDHLLSAFRSTQDPTTSLHVVGQPSTEELKVQLESLAGDDSRITLKLHFVDDDELVTEIGEASLVVLPYREMHNSAGVLTALSLGRGVLVPDNAANRLLAEEVGPEWVQLYQGQLSSGDIQRALTARQSIEGEQYPDLSRREWDEAGRAHATAYGRAVAAVRGTAVPRDRGE